MLRTLLTLTPLLASALQLSVRPLGVQRAAAVTMFEEQPPFEMRPAVTKGSSRSLRPGPSVIITEGTSSFYPARSLIQMLHDYAQTSLISTHGEAAAAKKALLSRQARYSGLLDVLEFREGDLAEAMASTDAWLAINADASTLPTQIAAATKAGVERAFVLFCDEKATFDLKSVEAMFEGSGLRYTVMRTGALLEAAESGAGLRIGEVDMAECEGVSKEDVFRFVTEALTLTEAEGRMFTLCPSEDSSQLKQMRLCGYGRRDEVKALLGGVIVDPETKEAAAEEAEAAPEIDMRSEAEVAEERAEELKELLARARARGEATQAKLKFEEAEKAKEREAQRQYYSKPSEPSDEE